MLVFSKMDCLFIFLLPTKVLPLKPTAQVISGRRAKAHGHRCQQGHGRAAPGDQGETGAGRLP